MDDFYVGSLSQDKTVREERWLWVVVVFLIGTIKIKTITKIKITNKKVRSAVTYCGHMMHLHHLTQIQQNQKCNWMSQFFLDFNDKPILLHHDDIIRLHFQLRNTFCSLW